MRTRVSLVCTITAMVLGLAGAAGANWVETFNSGEFDLTTWLFGGYPQLTGTFSATIQDGPGDDDYLVLAETSPSSLGGTQFGVGLGDPDDVFTDVRVGAVFNVAGDASLNYHGLAARTTYFIDDGSISGFPGVIASAYVMVIHYEEGPANLKVELVKAVNLDTSIMATWQPEVPVPGLDHGRSHYFQLDVVGSDPVYITGSVYDYEGGPLLVKTPTFIDTGANDPWEAPGIHDGVFAGGVSGVFGMWESPQSAGYRSPYDNVSSVSDGPAAVNPSPADGAQNVPVDTSLSWLEAQFATGRQLWLGKPGAMKLLDPAPAGPTYAPGHLEYGKTYQWRVDQIGPSGIVEGYTWTFTTAECQSLDDFESYANDAAIEGAWPHNIPPGNQPYHYIFLDTGTVNQGAKAMRYEYQNQAEPYFTEATRTFATAQDWAGAGITSISMVFRGRDDNVAQPMYIKLEDATGASHKVPHPQEFAPQTEAWNQWDIDLAEFADNGVDLSAVKKISLGNGNGVTASTQAPQDRDTIYIDNIRLCPLRCFNVDQVDLQGDVNGDCVVNFLDLALMGAGWLNDGLSALP